MYRPVHFELMAEDPDRAAKFYQEAFGWKLNKWDGPQDYWLIETGPEGTPGINGGMGLRQEAAGPGVINTLGVADLDSAMQAVEAAGGKITMPKMTIPGVGYLAYGQDTEGNPFGLMQGDPNAQA